MKPKMIAKVILLSALFFSFSANAQGGSSTQDEIQTLADKWTKAYNDFDGETLGNLYTENAHLYVHGSPMIIGREEVKIFWEDDFTIENPLTTLTVTHSVEGYDMMLVHGNYTVTDRKSNDQLGAGRFAHIWHEVNGEWLLDQDLWNQPYEQGVE